MRNFIFVWFFLAVIALMLVGLMGVFLTGPYFATATWSFYGSDLVEFSAQSELAAYEDGGLPALEAFQKRALSASRMRGYIFDATLKELQGQDVSARIREFAAHLHEGEAVRFETVNRGLFAGTVIKGRNGELYRVVDAFTWTRVLNTPANFWGWVLRIGMIMVAGTLLCSWLAWRLSKPLEHLQDTTRKLAAGELSVRAVVESFPKRPPEYGELARDFNEMAQRIESLINSQRRLLRDVSHELRTPLTRLGLAVNIARGEAGSAAPVFDRIDQESDRLNALIDRIIRLSRLETLAETPKWELIEMADFIDSIVSDAHFEAAAQGRKVTMGDCATCRLYGDRELLREALENVIRNAIRFAPQGTSVSVDARIPAQGLYIITIRDEGPGVSAEQLDVMFEAFQRGVQPADSVQGGFGLGLAIAKRAVQLHHGSVEGRNREGGGFQVEIRMPIKMAVG